MISCRWRTEASRYLHGRNIYEPNVDPVEVRRRIGMVSKAQPIFPEHLRQCRLGREAQRIQRPHGRFGRGIVAGRGALG